MLRISHETSEYTEVEYTVIIGDELSIQSIDVGALLEEPDELLVRGKIQVTAPFLFGLLEKLLL